MKKFFINGRFATQPVTGVQRYALEMVKALDKLLVSSEFSDDLEFTLLLPSSSVFFYEFSKIKCQKIGTQSGQIWEQLELPNHVDGFLINFCNTYPIKIRNQLCVFHDASVYSHPKNYAFIFTVFYKFLFRTAAKKKTLTLATVSQFSKMEIAQYTSIDRSRLHIMPCGADHWSKVTPDAKIIDLLNLKGTIFFLAVSSNNKNKNTQRLIEAFSNLNRSGVYLILVGGENRKIFSENVQNYSPDIIRTGYLSDAELAALYLNAFCLVFPSLYEGFGIPPLEAMHFGCPVISSREASLPEVGGEAVLYCDAFDAQDITAKMQMLIDHPSQRKSLVEKGFLQTKKFTWNSSVKILIREILRIS